MIEKVIPLLFCGLAAMLAPGAEETHAMLIADFDTPADAARFVPMKDNANRMTFNDQPEFIVSGTGSGRFYVPKAGTGEHRWPRVTLNLPADRQDWSAYDTLEMDIVNPLATEGRLGLNLYDSDGKSYPYYTQPVPPGRSQFVWKFPDAVRDHRITRLMLTVSDPVTEYTLYLDNIRATVSRSSLNARIEWQRKRLRADWPESEWRRGGMADDFAALDRRLKQLQTGDRPLPESLAEYAAIRADYLKKKQELIARLCRSAAEEFDRVWPAPAVWGYGWTGGTQKVYRADLPYQGKIGGTPEVALARREREGVQIVLRSRRKLADVRVQVGNLTDPATGAILPAQQIAVLPVGHVKTSTPPYPADPATWRPDPLLGFLKSFELDSDVWQAVWLDVSATAATPPGDYRGTVTVTADGAPELRIPLTVKVWSFALPEAMTQPQLFNYCTDGDHGIYTQDKAAAQQFYRYKEGKVAFEALSPEARRLRELEIATENLLLEHQITPSSLYITTRRQRIEDIERWHANHGSFYNITYVPPRPVAKGAPYPEWSRKLVLDNLAASVPELRRAGLLDRCFIYSFDEITDEKFFSAQQILSEIKRLYPDIPIVTTAYDRDFGRTNGLDRVIDVWCPQIERFVEQLDTVRQVQQSGKKVWFYSCLWDPGMDMLTEKPLTAPRLLVGFAQAKYGSDGFLYYSVISGQSRQQLIDGGPLTGHNGQGYVNYTGDGLLVYATTHGPQPALRLKAVRDGLEDMEYYRMLRKLDPARMTPADAATLAELLAVPETLITDLEIYDRTGEALERERRRAGELLSRYAAEK